jgi:DNA-directed RNA polymerase subunit RPC12/RpoP
MLGLFASAGIFVALAVNFGEAWAFGVPLCFLAYAIWSCTFKCPVCGTRYLFRNGGKGDPYGLVVIPTSFPINCRKCGHDSRVLTNDG